ncbi:DUF58 domain-containing protein [candidate division KSB1 bacterium]|nr:DUF58 domain-containing protein [candidate division KSB1 bacterium]NIR68676.1 DUF58 domain-containing protein [candidate division KSB1 bacterium]NIS27165.1 DUF58 domain-containing protein [candidate division KSB1 bacterium]NIT74051.1 DUF58 domain-containing protein [candidate division KSB1 bacterium]NIU27917.1 DUF58 domain-containing protein [candidate division KSB1 bacterium]
MAESKDKTPDYRKYLKPEIVSKLSSMDLRARLVVEGFITGMHKSPYHGFSVEFAEHRQYMPGDEIKNVDWKVYGKTDRFYVKQFEEETNLKSYLLMDASASMGYTSNGITKLDYGIYLAGALTYMMIRQRDAVGLLTFDDKIRRYLPPRSVNTYLHQILMELDATRSSSRTNLSVALHQMAERVKRRGLIILFSDLFDDPKTVLSGLKHFRHKKHEVIVFHILDPLELSFEFEQDAVFRDVETGEQINTQPWHIRKDYQNQVAGFIDDYKKVCRENQIDYVTLNTSESYERALVEYLLKRKRIGG